MKGSCDVSAAAVDAAVCFQVSAQVAGRRYTVSFDQADDSVSAAIEHTAAAITWTRLR
jgi:hypothetical protein